jgi:hypothetical protein
MPDETPHLSPPGEFCGDCRRAQVLQSADIVTPFYRQLSLVNPGQGWTQKSPKYLVSLGLPV